jgi:hypothetical protein
MSIWQPRAKSGSAVLILLEAKNWKQIEAALRDKNYTNTWEPIEAKVAKGKAKDFVYMGGPLIASDSAWRAIEEQVQNDVQNLPLGVGDTFFHILNVIRVVDCLDVERSKFFRTPYDKGLGEILHYEFQETSTPLTLSKNWSRGYPYKTLISSLRPHRLWALPS